VPDDERKADEKRPKTDPPAPADKFRPEAIAARIDTLGEETEVDRIAREEEKKLALRKKQTTGKKGLEAAASKRLANIGEGTVKRPTLGSDVVAPGADPLLERAARTGDWIKAHRQAFGALVTIGLLAVGATLGMVSWRNKQRADASALLAQAFAAERGRVSTKDDEEEDEAKSRPLLYPTFQSATQRRDAALAKYREVESKYAGTGAAYLAKLGEAGLLLDAGDGNAALGAYSDAKGSALAHADAAVRGRAWEGMGFADELLAAGKVREKGEPSDEIAPERGKYLDDALASYKQLEQIDTPGFKELGMYHQARIFQQKGDKAKAIELLKDVYKRVTEPGEKHAFSYLEFVVQDRLRWLDPTALPPKAAKLGGPGGNLDMSNPQIQQLIKQLQEKQQKGGGTQ
jgi:hypothetical protein